MSLSKKYFAIILCGGSGSRLWPYSRGKKPKQFLKIGDKYTLFQNTILRIQKQFYEENILIVTNKDFYHEVYSQLLEIDKSAVNIILEPESKNTLPAISYGVKKIYDLCSDATVGVFSSDHYIDGDKEFCEAWEQSVQPASKNFMTIFGIRPTEPNTGYGYIKLGKKFGRSSKSIYMVDRFVEKPNKDQAQKYVKNNYLWNSGIFIFNISFYLKSLQKHQTDIYNHFFKLSESQLIKNFNKLPNLSIDYGLLEFLDNICVVDVSFLWSDLGSWNSIHNFYNNNSVNNTVTIGNIVADDVKNSLIQSNDKLVAVCGVDDLIIINELDALLVCHKTKADFLKPFLEKVKSHNPKILDEHPLVNRPWGNYKILHESSTFKIKSIIVKPKHRLSLQLHKFRNEHWVVVSGKAKVRKGDSVFYLNENESTYIKVNEKHQLENDTEDEIEIIEVSIGSKVIEEDIVRFGDDYGRL